MTPTREELLAQRAEIDAKLAALDAEREIAEIAEKVVAEKHGGTPMVFAVAAIRETLRRVPAWLGEEADPYIVYADDEGWFDWRGGECPVPAETPVVIEWYSGRRQVFNDGYDGRWLHVKRYRIIPGEEA